jgi:type I restriction enzyme S subunit
MNLPSGWKRGRLGEECSIEIGGTPSRNIPAYWDDAKETTNLWVSIRDLNQREITRTAEQITAIGVKHSNVKLQPKGTVLLSFKLTIGRVAVAGIPLYTNEAIAGLQSQTITRDYLYHGLQEWDLLQGVDQAIKGATLNKEKLKRIEFDFPESTSEQAKIVEILSTVDRAIEQTDALIAKQQRIKTGLMQHLLTRGIDEHGNIRSEATHAFKDSPLGRIPFEWEVKAIGEVARVRSGTTPSRSNTDFWDEGTIPWVKTGEVNFGEILQTEEKVTDLALRKTSLHLEPVETVLVAMYGQGDTRGRCCFLGIEATTNQACAAIVGFKDKVNQKYLYHCLASQYSDLRIVGHGSNQVNLSGKLLSAFKIKLPPVAEQRRIADSFTKVDPQLNVLRRQLEKLRLLKTALMQDLLTGRKRVTDLLASKPKREKVYAGH